MADLVDKAEEVVTGNVPHVIGALRRIRFLIIGIPLLSVVISIVTQAIIPERHVVSATFKVGSFAVADTPTTTIPLAGEQQMAARIRATGRAIRDQFEGSLLLTTTLTDDVMKLTATAEGNDVAKEFLSEVIDKEVAFHNGRLDKLIAVQDTRRVFLDNQIKELSERTVTVTEARISYLRRNKASGPGSRCNKREWMRKIRSPDIDVNSVPSILPGPAICLWIPRQWYRPL